MTENHIIPKYVEFFQKDFFNSFSRAMKFGNGKYIDKLVESVSNGCDVCGFYGEADVHCVFNPLSVQNQIRKFEKGAIYLNESVGTMTKAEDFISRAKMAYFSMFSKSTVISKDDNRFFFRYQLDYVDENGIAGLITMYVMVDKSVHSVNDTARYILRYADLDGYSCNNYYVVEKDCFGDDNLCMLKIELEAMYIENDTLKPGDFLYHVTPSSLAKKIVDGKRGIIPCRKDVTNRNYPDRVYLFVDKDDFYIHMFPSVAHKVSKRFFNNSESGKIRENFILPDEKLNGRLYDTREYSILRVDTAKLENVKFYRDNHFNVDGKFLAVFTTDNIPYTAIDIVETFELI